MPAPVSPRLSFASGFLLDTIPGWQQGDDLPARRAQGAPRVGRGPGRPHGEGGRGQRHLRPGQLRPVRADRVPHPGDEGAGGADRRPTSPRERGLDPFDVLCEIVVADDLRTGFSFPPNGDTRARLGGPARGVARPPLGARARPTPAPTSTSWPRSTSRPSCCAGRSADLGLLSWEEAIALLTDAPARLYGLRDRGRLAVGCVGRRRRARPRPHRAAADRQPGRPAGRRLAALRRGRRHRPRARQRRRRRRRRRGHRRPPRPGAAVRHATPSPCTPDDPETRFCVRIVALATIRTQKRLGGRRDPDHLRRRPPGRAAGRVRGAGARPRCADRRPADRGGRRRHRGVAVRRPAPPADRPQRGGRPAQGGVVDGAGQLRRHAPRAAGTPRPGSPTWTPTACGRRCTTRA